MVHRYRAIKRIYQTAFRCFYPTVEVLNGRAKGGGKRTVSGEHIGTDGNIEPLFIGSMVLPDSSP